MDTHKARKNQKRPKKTIKIEVKSIAEIIEREKRKPHSDNDLPTILSMRRHVGRKIVRKESKSLKKLKNRRNYSTNER